MKLKTQMLPRFDHPSLHPPHPHPTPNPLDSQGAQAWEAGPGCPLTLTHTHGYVSSQNSLLSSDLRKLLILSQTHPGHTLGMRLRCRSQLFLRYLNLGVPRSASTSRPLLSCLNKLRAPMSPVPKPETYKRP